MNISCFMLSQSIELLAIAPSRTRDKIKPELIRWVVNFETPWCRSPLKYSTRDRLRFNDRIIPYRQISGRNHNKKLVRDRGHYKKHVYKENARAVRKKTVHLIGLFRLLGHPAPQSSELCFWGRGCKSSSMVFHWRSCLGGMNFYQYAPVYVMTSFCTLRNFVNKKLLRYGSSRVPGSNPGGSRKNATDVDEKKAFILRAVNRRTRIFYTF